MTPLPWPDLTPEPGIIRDKRGEHRRCDRLGYSRLLPGLIWGVSIASGESDMKNLGRIARVCALVALVPLLSGAGSMTGGFGQTMISATEAGGGSHVADPNRTCYQKELRKAVHAGLRGENAHLAACGACPNSAGC